MANQADNNNIDGRESGLKTIVKALFAFMVGVIAVILVYRLAVTLEIDLTNFDFSDYLL